MRRAKVAEKAKKVLLQKDIADTFSSISGADGPDPAIAIKKYDEYVKYLSNCFSILNSFGDKIKDYDMKTFAVKGARFLADNKPPRPNPKREMDKAIKMEYMLNKYDALEIGSHYTKLKDSEYVAKLIIIYSELKPYNDKIKSKSDDWIIESGEHSMTFMHEITKRDFLMECNSGTHDYSIYIHFAIGLLYNNMVHLRELHSSPDIDVEKVVGVLMEAIDDVQKHIPRCDKAFSVIKSNASLLKNKFGDYYKDFQQSGSRVIILENFIADVSKNAEGDPQLMSQFRRIIGFIRENAQKSGAASDPRLAGLMETALGQLGGDDKKDDDGEKGEDSD